MAQIDLVQFGRLITAVESLTTRVDCLTAKVEEAVRDVHAIKGIFRTVRTVAITSLALIVGWGLISTMGLTDAVGEVFRRIFGKLVG